MSSEHTHKSTTAVRCRGIRTPMVAFALALFGDLARVITADPGWGQFSYLCLGVGICMAAIAAVYGLLDYSELLECMHARRILAVQMLLNIGAIGLYVGNVLLRRHDGLEVPGAQPFLVAANVAALVTLLAATWVGRSFEQREDEWEPRRTEYHGAHATHSVLRRSA